MKQPAPFSKLSLKFHTLHANVRRQLKSILHLEFQETLCEKLKWKDADFWMLQIVRFQKKQADFFLHHEIEKVLYLHRTGCNAIFPEGRPSFSNALSCHTTQQKLPLQFQKALHNLF